MKHEPILLPGELPQFVMYTLAQQFAVVIRDWVLHLPATPRLNCLASVRSFRGVALVWPEDGPTAASLFEVIKSPDDTSC